MTNDLTRMAQMSENVAEVMKDLLLTTALPKIDKSERYLMLLSFSMSHISFILPGKRAQLLKFMFPNTNNQLIDCQEPTPKSANLPQKKSRNFTIFSRN
jgi:hypothetical protein